MQRKALMVAGAVPGSDDTLDKVLQRFAFGPSTSVPGLGEAVARLRDEPHDLLIVPLHEMGPIDLATIDRETRRSPSMFVIGMAPQASSELILSAMRAGVHEFVQSPPDAHELAAAVDRLLRRSQVAETNGVTVAVYSAKGGLGTTTLAINLAYSFVRNNPSARVALADFVVSSGDVSVLLDLRPSYDIGDLAIKANRIDADLLKSTLTQAPGGVYVLPSGDQPEVGDLVDASVAATILAQLRASFGFTVIDCEHHLTDRTLASLDTADRIVLVTQLNIAALRSTQRSIQVCRRLGYPDEKLFVVVTRYQSSDLVSPTDAAQVLEREISYKIPNDWRTAAAALTKGQSITQYDSSSALATAYAGLAAKLGGAAPATAGGNGKKTPTSRFGRLLGMGRKD